ncbi:CLD1 [Brettanomyces bruxellensis]|uniref:DEBR0S2_15984g1_1 n=1 Tax=Dekkera bruxellensis TaxID=5007 RepID=A0A7D9CX06_DEKBR|nr:CLD1 [Brettanomyces bruxellensis]
MSNPKHIGEILKSKAAQLLNLYAAKRRLTSTYESFTSSQLNSRAGYQISTPPVGLDISGLLKKKLMFPLSVRDSIDHFKKRHQLDLIQDALLSTLPFYPNATQTHLGEVVRTVVDEKTGCYINEFHVVPQMEIPESGRKHVVFIHGYGAGLGFFIKNIEEITKRKPNWDIHAIDLPGYGCSSRPDFPYQVDFSNYKKIENWFAEKLERWFDVRGLNQLDTVVIAHSMGAYLSCVVNIRRPDLFNKLLLVSPAGIYHSAKDTVVSTAPDWFQKLWNQNISPFSLVRLAGPLGSKLVSGWSNRRFSKDNSLLGPQEQKLMHQYTYAIFNAKGSGEYMLNYFLAPGGVPRHPMLQRIRKLRCDTVWMYGSHDWMDKAGGFKACQKLKTLHHLNGEPLSATCHVIEHSGHHIYLDNFKEFNNLVIRELEAFEKSALQLSSLRQNAIS